MSSHAFTETYIDRGYVGGRGSTGRMFEWGTIIPPFDFFSGGGLIALSGKCLLLTLRHLLLGPHAMYGYIKPGFWHNCFSTPCGKSLVAAVTLMTVDECTSTNSIHSGHQSVISNKWGWIPNWSFWIRIWHQILSIMFQIFGTMTHVQYRTKIRWRFSSVAFRLNGNSIHFYMAGNG